MARRQGTVRSPSGRGERPPVRGAQLRPLPARGGERQGRVPAGRRRPQVPRLRVGDRRDGAGPLPSADRVRAHRPARQAGPLLQPLLPLQPGTARGTAFPAERSGPHLLLQQRRGGRGGGAQDRQGPRPRPQSGEVPHHRAGGVLLRAHAGRDFGHGPAQVQRTVRTAASRSRVHSGRRNGRPRGRRRRQDSGHHLRAGPGRRRDRGDLERVRDPGQGLGRQARRASHPGRGPVRAGPHRATRSPSRRGTASAPT